MSKTNELSLQTRPNWKPSRCLLRRHFRLFGSKSVHACLCVVSDFRLQCRYQFWDWNAFGRGLLNRVSSSSNFWARR